jgi:hypothetical protein
LRFFPRHRPTNTTCSPLCSLLNLCTASVGTFGASCKAATQGSRAISYGAETTKIQNSLRLDKR